MLSTMFALLQACVINLSITETVVNDIIHCTIRMQITFWFVGFGHSPRSPTYLTVHFVDWPFVLFFQFISKC